MNFSDNSTIRDKNLTQLKPTQITGNGLIFKGCNLVNCILPDDAEVIDCLRATKDFCAWLHPKLDLEPETINCRHVTETVTVDGEIVGYIREDVINGNTN